MKKKIIIACSVGIILGTLIAIAKFQYVKSRLHITYSEWQTEQATVIGIHNDKLSGIEYEFECQHGKFNQILGYRLINIENSVRYRNKYLTDCNGTNCVLIKTEVEHQL